MTTTVLLVAIAIGAGLGVLALLSYALVQNDRGDPMAGLLVAIMRLYARVVQKVRVEGREHIPTAINPGPLIVVSNHTAGADIPILQSLCRFEIRWIMARSMQIQSLQWFWEWANVIGVDLGSRDTAAIREAIRHVAAGGVLGIFPEGGLERPARHIMPFQPGVGLLVKKTGARVLPILIDGTPQVEPAWASLWRFGRARVRAFPMIDYARTGMSASEIVQDLQRRYEEWSGWPVNPRGPRHSPTPGGDGPSAAGERATSREPESTPSARDAA
ncbi:MAG: lysophospholipid acyltransferase family protein [Phycisphaerales bacterium]